LKRESSAFAMGQGAGAVHAVKPAGEIVRDMMAEAEEVLAKMARLVRAAS
jgi:NAD(P)H-dependent flavin oxidoreductase YrpB (nitropropane dioxygenase family)